MRKVEAREEILGNVQVWTTWGKDSWMWCSGSIQGKISHKRESKLRTAKWQADEQKGV